MRRGLWVLYAVQVTYTIALIGPLRALSDLHGASLLPFVVAGVAAAYAPPRHVAALTALGGVSLALILTNPGEPSWEAEWSLALIYLIGGIVMTYAAVIHGHATATRARRARWSRQTYAALGDVIETLSGEASALPDSLLRISTYAERVVPGARVRLALLDGARAVTEIVALPGADLRAEPNDPRAARVPAEQVDHLLGGDIVGLSPGWLPTGEATPASSVLVPLRAHDDLVGVITLDREEAPPSDAELSALHVVARLATLVLERARAEAERDQAVEMRRRLDEFIAVAGHELRTPLTAIKGYAQLMALQAERSGVDDPMTAERIDAIVRSSLRLQRLIESMLDLSRAHAGRLVAEERAPANLAAIALAAVEEQRVATPDREIVLHAEPTWASADADRIHQVVANFLTNALKFSRGAVVVRVERRGAWARVAVRDRGVGLSAEQLARVWRRFEQAGSKVQYGSAVGLGLGLYICREIVERHGGRVGAESRQGIGSTFWFELPAVEPPTD